jgi:hypothetical protein
MRASQPVHDRIRSGRDDRRGRTQVVHIDPRMKRRRGRRRALAVIFLLALVAGFTLLLVFSEVLHSLRS